VKPVACFFLNDADAAVKKLIKLFIFPDEAFHLYQGSIISPGTIGSSPVRLTAWGRKRWISGHGFSPAGDVLDFLRPGRIHDERQLIPLSFTRSRHSVS